MTLNDNSIFKGEYVRAPDRVVVSWEKSRLPIGILILINKLIVSRTREIFNSQDSTMQTNPIIDVV